MFVNKIAEIKADPDTQFGVVKIQPISDNHVRLEMVNHVAQYELDIRQRGNWVTFGTPLMPDTQGTRNERFYGEVLDLNSQLNGAKIGRENDRLILVREDPFIGLDNSKFLDTLNTFNAAHEVAFPMLLETADSFGLRFKERGDNTPPKILLTQNNEY